MNINPNVQNAQNEQNGVFRFNHQVRNRPAAPQHIRRRNFMQERANERERELRLREMEDARIATIREEIFRVQSDEEMDREIINLTVSMLNEQINNIFLNRAEREQTAIEREIARQQQEMEERIRERERAAQEANTENKTDEELEQLSERVKIRALANIDARLNNISGLSRTRAVLSGEATRLSGETDFDMRRQSAANAEIIRSARENGAAVSHLFSHNPLSHENFRGRHLQRLNEGIARITVQLNHQVASMYRDSQQTQENQLRIAREMSPARTAEQAEDNDYDAS